MIYSQSTTYKMQSFRICLFLYDAIHVKSCILFVVLCEYISDARTYECEICITSYSSVNESKNSNYYTVLAPALTMRIGQTKITSRKYTHYKAQTN